MVSDVKSSGGIDVEMTKILDDMLANDETITARAVARVHPRISAASSITRSIGRSRLLADYQERQSTFRDWRGKPGRLSKAAAAEALAQRDLRIAQLESRLALLTASHVAMIRAVGELGGFGKWAKFFESYSDFRARLTQLGALPEARVTPLPSQHVAEHSGKQEL